MSLLCTLCVDNRVVNPLREILMSDCSQKENEIQGVAAIRALADLPDPTNTSISVITGPKVRYPSLHGCRTG